MRGKTTLAVLLISLTICAIAPSGLAADKDPADAEVLCYGGASSDRLTMRHCFDFEKGHLVSEVRQVPVKWKKIVTGSDSPAYDRGHPSYNEGWLVAEGRRIDLRSAATAFCGKIPRILAEPSLKNLQRALLLARSKIVAPRNRYLRLKIYKGKVSYQTRDFIPISRLNSYRLDGKIRTHNFRGIRGPVKAWMSILWYRDDNEESICRHADGSPVIFKTLPIESETGEEWRDMRLLFNRTPFDANYVKIRVTVEGVSTTAEVDFDDIVLTQEPQVLLEFNKMPALFFGDEESVLNVELGGLPDGEYVEEIVLEDISLGEAVPVHRCEVRFAVAGGTDSVTNRKIDIAVGRRGVFRLKYDLALADGRADLPVASREIVFARALGAVPFVERGRYGATMDFFATPFAGAFDFVRLAGTSPLKTTLWGLEGNEDADGRTLERMLKLMRRNSIVTTGIITPLSPSHTVEMGMSSTGSLYAMFRQPSANAEKVWYDFIGEKSAAWAENLSHVQLGEDCDSSIVDTGLYRDIEKKLRAVLPRPLDSARMALPVRGLTDKPLPAGEYLVYYVGADVRPGVLKRRLEAMRDFADRLWITLEPPVVYDGAETPAQIADMVRKIVLCRVYNVRSVIVPLVASVSKKNALLSYKARPDETLDVNPLAVAMLNVASVLEGAEFEDEFVSGDVRVTVFRKKEKFVAMLYSDVPSVSSRMYWGGGLVAYDAMGNPRKISGENNMALIDGIGPLPIFVDNIDVGVARLAEIHLPYTPADLPGKIWVGLRETGGRQFANLYITPDVLEGLAGE